MSDERGGEEEEGMRNKWRTAGVHTYIHTHIYIYIIKAKLLI